MSPSRSIFAARQQDHNHNIAETRKANGRFWSSRSMNNSSPDGATFSFRSMFSPLLSPANMLQSEEQTKEPPQPAADQDRLAPAHDYAEKFFRNFHHHHLSDTTTGSTDSSPISAISTVDDSSATEPSPGSSPESPPPTTFAVGMLRSRTSEDSQPFFELQKQPPPKKGRNLKGLAVNTSRHPNRAASTTSLPLSTGNKVMLPGVMSPSFVKPPTPAKRKPSNLGLTLLTPGGSNKAPPQEIRLAIPPTPAVTRPNALRHFQSSPSLPLFAGLSSQSPMGPPISRITTTLETILSPVAQVQEPAAEEEEQNFDIPLSKEEKPEAYPNGPICVYEPHIDLYLEPTAEQARQYDVIMNVASEVRNPFLLQSVIATAEPEIRIDGGGGIQYAPKRDQNTTQRDSKDLTYESSPTTPKATPLEATFPFDDKFASEKAPEYIHIKWEHNSDIVPDLLRLCKLIDDMTMQSRRVLVHCQCGVSRSASLVVAYGLYKNPSLSVQDAYDAVKKRSKWIGPNMNLIMQLQEFRTSLMNGGLLSANRGLSPITPSSAISEWRGPFSSNPSEPKGPLSASVGSLSTQPAGSPPVYSPGPSSAPSGFSWTVQDVPQGQRARAISAAKPGTAYVDPSGRVVPVVPVLNLVQPDTKDINKPKQPLTSEQNCEESDSATPTEQKSSPITEENFAMTPLQPSPDYDPADTFGLMSPSSTEFATSPFDRGTLLAQLGMGSVRQQDDPPRRSVSLRSRQKPQQGEELALPPQPRESTPARRLRGKISSPGIREQEQLQSLQARIEASLPHRPAYTPTINGIDEALMSPRATEFTENPFVLALSIPPDTPSSSNDPSRRDSDPRSPAQKGASPITRSILDVL